MGNRLEAVRKAVGGALLLSLAGCAPTVADQKIIPTPTSVLKSNTNPFDASAGPRSQTQPGLQATNQALQTEVDRLRSAIPSTAAPKPSVAAAKPEAQPTFAPGFSPAEVIKEPGWAHFKGEEFEADIPPTWKLIGPQKLGSALGGPGSEKEYQYRFLFTINDNLMGGISFITGYPGINDGLGSNAKPFTLSGYPAKRLQTFEDRRSSQRNGITIAALINNGSDLWSIYINNQTEAQGADFDKFAQSFKIIPLIK